MRWRCVALASGLLLSVAHTSSAPAQQVAAPSLRVVWQQHLPFLSAQPQVADGMVRAFAGYDVHALDLASGASLWAVQPPPPQGQALLLGCCQTGAAPTETGLYTLAGGNGVWALDPATGDVRWRRPLGDAVLAPPVAGSAATVGVLALEGQDTVLYGLHSASGHAVWQARPQRALPLLAAAGDTFFASAPNGATMAFGADDGRLLWTSSANERPALISNQQISGQLLVLPTRDSVVALDRATGGQRWAAPLPAVPLDPRLVEDTAYARTVEGTLLALDVHDGSERWRTEVGAEHARQLSGPTDGRLFVVGMDGVVALDATSGGQLWTWSSDDVPVAPVALDDVAYIVTSSGDLVMLDAARGVERGRLALRGMPLVDPILAPDGTLLVATDGPTGSDLFAIRRAETS